MSNAHIENVIKKGASRRYLLRQLKRAKGDPAQLPCFYTTCIRPMSEYACLPARGEPFQVTVAKDYVFV